MAKMRVIRVSLAIPVLFVAFTQRRVTTVPHETSRLWLLTLRARVPWRTMSYFYHVYPLHAFCYQPKKRRGGEGDPNASTQPTLEVHPEAKADTLSSRVCTVDSGGDPPRLSRFGFLLHTCLIDMGVLEEEKRGDAYCRLQSGVQNMEHVISLLSIGRKEGGFVTSLPPFITKTGTEE